MFLRLVACIVLAGISINLNSQVATAQPINIKTTTLVEVHVTARNEIKRVDDPFHATAEVAGNEQSQCRPYGHQSFATATARVRIDERLHSGLRMDFYLHARANGGHYRTCGACVQNQCVIISGNNTIATARVIASTSTEINFDTGVEGMYEILITPINIPPNSAIDLIEAGGPVTSISRSEPSMLSLLVKAGDRLFLNSRMNLRVQDADLSLNPSLDIEVRPAAILAAQFGSLEPFILNGMRTADYEFVGAIGLRGDPHCTGTVVAKRTILTAGHCISAYGEAIARGELDFRIGKDFFDPEKIFLIGGSRVHDDYNPDRCTPQNPECFNDIALAYTAEEMDVEFAILHDGKPSWIEYNKEVGSAVFVGFGYGALSSGRPVSPGLKREAMWSISEVLERRVRWANPRYGSCQGDSGGPGFMKIPDNGSSISYALASITSVGDRDACSFGTNIRVDAYLSWLGQHIRS